VKNKLFIGNLPPPGTSGTGSLAGQVEPPGSSSTPRQEVAITLPFQQRQLGCNEKNLLKSSRRKLPRPAPEGDVLQNFATFCYDAHGEIAGRK
jgi:hypothetical protein